MAVASILPITTAAIASPNLWCATKYNAESLIGRIRIDGITKATSASQGGCRRSHASSIAIGVQRAIAAVILFSIPIRTCSTKTTAAASGTSSNSSARFR